MDTRDLENLNTPNDDLNTAVKRFTFGNKLISARARECVRGSFVMVVLRILEPEFEPNDVWDIFLHILKVAAGFDLDAESVTDLLCSGSPRIRIVLKKMPPRWLDFNPASVFFEAGELVRRD